MSAKKKPTETPPPAEATLPPNLNAAFRMLAGAVSNAATNATELAERVAVAHTSIELARLRGHADPIAEVRAAALLVLAAGEALQIERQEDKERERMQRDQWEAQALEIIEAGEKDSFALVPFTEIVGKSPGQIHGLLEASWRREWEEELLDKNFQAVFTGEMSPKVVAMPDVLAGRQAVFDADLRGWPLKTVSGFKKFLKKWVPDIAADKSHEPWDAEQRRNKVEEYFQKAKAGEVDRNLLDSWKFWRAKRAAMEKWGGATRGELWELLKKWVPSLPRNAVQTLTPQELDAQVTGHFQKAIEGKASPEMVEKWKAFRHTLTRNRG